MPRIPEVCCLECSASGPSFLPHARSFEYPLWRSPITRRNSARRQRLVNIHPTQGDQPMARAPSPDPPFHNSPARRSDLSPYNVAPYLNIEQPHSPEAQGARTPPTLLVPKHAWQLVCRKTGTSLSRTTFYRWLREGRIVSVRVGHRLFVPVGALDELVSHCLAGERC